MIVRLAALALCLALAGPALADDGPKEAHGDDAQWWHSGYLVDYGIIAAGGAIYFSRKVFGPADKALFGPVWNPEAPASIFDAKYSQTIGRTHLNKDAGETVSTNQVIGLVALGSLYLAAQEGIPGLQGRPGSARRFHDMMIGYMESVSITVGFTETAKLAIGRLRPDFQDRARRHLCSEDANDAPLCPDGKTAPLAPHPDEAEDIFLDGRKSFFSGHASNSFNFATYTSLAIGGAWVWGEGATTISRTLGILSQTALFGTAFYIASSRVSDGRHHLSDVMTGALVGFGVANLSYWRRFQINGQVRERTDHGASTVSVDPGPGAIGLSVTLRTL